MDIVDRLNRLEQSDEVKLEAATEIARLRADQEKVQLVVVDLSLKLGKAEAALAAAPTATDIAHLIVEHLNEDQTNALEVGRMVLARFQRSPS